MSKEKKQKSQKRVKKDNNRKSIKAKKSLCEKEHKLKKDKKTSGPQPKTPDGKNIRDMLLEEKIKGNYKDYACLIESQIVDFRGSVTVSTKDGKPIMLSEEVRLIHKKKLKNVVSKNVAEMFWHPIFGRVK